MATAIVCAYMYTGGLYRRNTLLLDSGRPCRLIHGFRSVVVGREVSAQQTNRGSKRASRVITETHSFLSVVHMFAAM